MFDKLNAKDANVFKKGDRVFVVWDDGYLYPGIIESIKRDQIHMTWDSENTTDWMPKSSLRLLELEQGDTIECRWKQEESYYAAKIISINGEDLHLEYIEDGIKEETTLNMVRLAENYMDERDNEDSELELYDGPNAESYNLIDEMYFSLSYLDKKGVRYATSLEEADKAEEILNSAEEQMQDSSDTELTDLISQNREHLAEARTRRFSGYWWLIICAGIVAIYSFYNAFNTMGQRLTVESAQNILNSQLNSFQNHLNRLEAKPQKTEKDSEYIESYKKKIEKTKKTSAVDYASDYKSNRISRGLRLTFGAFISLGWIIAYYLVSRPYGYMRFKRQREYQIIQKTTGWGAKIVSGILGVFWSIPITTYVTKYTDGSEERDSDAIFVLGIQVFVTVFIIGTILYISHIIIPIVTIISYLRNFPDKPGSKQVHYFFKNRKSIISKYIDKIKSEKMN